MVSHFSVLNQLLTSSMFALSLCFFLKNRFGVIRRGFLRRRHRNDAFESMEHPWTWLDVGSRPSLLPMPTFNPTSYAGAELVRTEEETYCPLYFLHSYQAEDFGWHTVVVLVMLSGIGLETSEEMGLQLEKIQWNW